MKFKIGDLVAYDNAIGRLWGIIIEFDEWTPNSKTAQVYWTMGWTAWYNTDYLIMKAKAK